MLASLTRHRLVIALLLFLLGRVAPAETLPPPVAEILSERCLGCHDAATESGEVNLESVDVNWNRPEELDRWIRVFDAVDRGFMPPPDGESLSRSERAALLDDLGDKLAANISTGRTPPRRLSREEYEGTIRSLFQLNDFKLPAGFPKDAQRHGFDNTAAGLVLSPAHLTAFADAAREVADRLFPPARGDIEPVRWEAGPEDLVLSFSAATVHDDALRLVSRSVDVMRSCTWPSRIEVRDSGTYRISIDASQFRSESGRDFDGPMLLDVYARPVAASDRSKLRAFRKLRTIQVRSESPDSFTFKADLFEGETVLFHWANAEMTHAHAELAEHFASWFKRDRRFLAAWQMAVFPGGKLTNPITTSLRGRNGWRIVSEHWSDPNLDLSQATMDSPLTKKFLEVADSNQGTFNLADALCHFYHDHGPAVEIHRVAIEGPSKRVASPADKARLKLQIRLTGPRDDGQSDEAIARQMLTRFLPAAFRRGVDQETLDAYFNIARRHLEQGHTLDQTLHLLVRTVLVSPRFLYRCLQPGVTDDYDLAARLSYFLTQRPPDATLVDLARRGRLSATRPKESDPSESEYWVIRREAERLLPRSHDAPFIRSFVGQWLDTRKLPGIMPDPKFRFSENEVALARLETERFFFEMLSANRPMEDFIDPDFTFTSVQFAQRNYGFTPAFALDREQPLTASQKRKFRRIEIQRGGRYGGLLGQAAIQMVTANGVDTQPVIRGVWVLENMLGMPPPEPPKNVPALTPDTRGATTPRELLAAHTEATECARCHRHIDPIGLVLEHYDPVGRWRTRWPGVDAAIDARGVLPDGTEVRNPVEFKRWMVQHIDRFSECLAEKLMTYATGRVPNFAERRELRSIVRRNRESGNGFRDLLLALLESETFRTR